jgi:hypothetical protein
MFNNGSDTPQFAFPSADCKKDYKTQQLSAGVTALVCVYPSNCSSRDCALVHVTKCLTREIRAYSFGVSVVVVVVLVLIFFSLSHIQYAILYKFGHGLLDVRRHQTEGADRFKEF